MFKAEVKVQGDDTWYANGLAFETYEKAEEYAIDLFRRWLLTVAYRVVEVESND